MPSGREVGALFEARLNEARPLYDFSDKPEVVNATSALGRLTRQATPTNAPNLGGANSSMETPAPSAGAESIVAPVAVKKLDKIEATKLWDKLQARGCCGFNNATSEWESGKFPKSCCSKPGDVENNLYTCKLIDEEHNHPCRCVIESSSLNLLILLALIALVNLYLATITGVNAYRTCHYDEANQSAAYR